MQSTSIITCGNPRREAKRTPSRKESTSMIKGFEVPKYGLHQAPRRAKEERATPPPAICQIEGSIGGDFYKTIIRRPPPEARQYQRILARQVKERNGLLRSSYHRRGISPFFTVLNTIPGMPNRPHNSSDLSAIIISKSWVTYDILSP